MFVKNKLDSYFLHLLYLPQENLLKKLPKKQASGQTTLKWKGQNNNNNNYNLITMISIIYN